MVTDSNASQVCRKLFSNVMRPFYVKKIYTKVLKAGCGKKKCHLDFDSRRGSNSQWKISIAVAAAAALLGGVRVAYIYTLYLTPYVCVYICV